ncbi:internalin [Sporocytophaga myxococcoides]|uniref:Internalin n=1 Tax=Sporocytophaga myxococcoides TaxID=153721 RepID=A0A098LL70_9BACT|nr:T9SS type A sorting domain-containing protein [Sporocytophaga myxococcoides]GAL86833.1 internalin [Sporocytophaga myxococcoides]
MKKALLFFIGILLVNLNILHAQDAPPQRFLMTLGVKRAVYHIDLEGGVARMFLFYNGKPASNQCDALDMSGVVKDQWKTFNPASNSYGHYDLGDVDSTQNLNFRLFAFSKRCKKGVIDMCSYNPFCVCDGSGCPDGDRSPDQGTIDFNMWFKYGIPATWNAYYVRTDKNAYEVELGYFFTPPHPNYPKAVNLGTNNVCVGDTIRLKTDCIWKKSEYVWQEMTDGIRWEEIPGQNGNTLTVIVPPNTTGKVIKKNYRVYSRYNGVTSYLPTNFLTTIFVQPDGPHIENTNAYILTTNVKCAGESSGKIKVLKVDGSGTYYYALKNLDDPSFPILNSSVTYPIFPDDAYNKTEGMTGLPKGTYELVVKNGYYSVCSNFIHITISEPALLNLGIPADLTYLGGTNISCNGFKDGKITLSAIGGVKPYTYYLSTSSDFSSSQQSSLNQFSNLSAGYYYMKVKDNNGCFSNIQKDTLQQPSVFKSSVLAFDAKCNGSNDGVISFVNTSGGTLPYSYSVNNHENYLTSASINSLAPASYSCHAKDANGCGIKDTTVSVSEPDKLVIIPSNITEATCFDKNDGSFSVTGIGGIPDYKFSLDNGEYFTKKDFTFISGGNHIVRIKDKNECIDTLSVYVGRPDSIAINFNITEVQCAGFSNGVIKTSVSGGIKPFIYQWQNFPEKDSLIEKLPPGSYNLSIVDANNCKSSKVAIITEPSNQLEVSFATRINPKCNIECNGQLEILASGGTPPYYYQWNNDTTLTTAALNNLCQGTFKARILDSRNCIASLESTLQDSVQFVFSIPDSTIICPGKQVTFDAGNIGSDYEWRDEQSLLTKAQIFTTHTDGTYHLKVKNADGCYAEKTFKLKTSKELLSAQFLLPSFVEYGDTVVFVEVSNPLPDSIQWSFSGDPLLLDSPKDSPELYFWKPGTYSVKLTAFLGECTDSIRKTITFFIPPTSVGSDDSLGLGLNKIKAVKIFPNPNNGIFNAQIDLDKEQAIDIEIINSQGLPISKASYNGQENYLLNFSLPLGTGVYLMKILTPTDFRTIGFIVQ